MCGIVAYLGSREAVGILMTGLSRLEYRGYDSAGLATMADGELQVRRTVGRVAKLAQRLESEPVRGQIGIAHTRWATHGRPTEPNAHPHSDSRQQITLVHNGVIENHAALRTFLQEQGVEFASETDTEVLAQLIGLLYQQTHDFVESVRAALRQVHGTFGLVVLCTDFPDRLIAARRGSPVLVGVGNDEFIVASDGSAIAGHLSEVMYLNDDEIALLGPDGLVVTSIDCRPVTKRMQALEVTLDEIELGTFEHHMLKEVYEQPESLRNAFRGRLNPDNGQLMLGGLAPIERELSRCRRVLLFGCGTAWHAGLIGEYLFEELAGIPCEIDYASELRYRNPLIEDGTLAIAISQSGETADTLAALKEVRMRGALAVGLVNVVGSSIARETDAGIYLHVGPEIGVASTKAFTAQVAVLAMLATFLGRRRHLSSERVHEVLQELGRIPEKIEETLGLNQQILELAERLLERENWLYLGRGVNYPVALEGALKLKEISYLHAEGLPAAEMKHGPIAMIDAGMPVIVLAPRDHTYDKILSNIEEVRSREGYVVAITTEGDRQIAGVADEVIYVPETLPLLSPLVTTIPLQLLAYHVAVLRGHDVDKPRNLAKSVTVE